ncbi:hypothetical protein V1478_010076 [Vespula squamosa]|uniref:Uncharacterized protein n=1 Tax=Vespula squamosa TaxID=30214 RepID=A0ABD2ALE1_VESSQ
MYQNPYSMKSHSLQTRIFITLASMNVTRSSLFPTAMVLPSGDHDILIFSPLVLILAVHFWVRVSQIRTVLSPLAVDKCLFST